MRKNLIVKAYKTFVAASILAVAIWGFLAFQKITIAGSPEIYDGLGRFLVPTPTWAHFLLAEGAYWPGDFWGVFDRIFFISFCIFHHWLFQWYERYQKNEGANQ